MRANTLRTKLWLGVGVAALAAVAVTGALGAPGGGTITTIAGTGTQGFFGDGGPAIRAQLRSVYGVAVDQQGNVYVADTANRRVRKVSPSGMITTFAGTGSAPVSVALRGDGGQAASAALYFPVGLAVDGQGNVYIADFHDDRVRKVSPDGTITTIAGTDPRTGKFGDGGPATSTRLSGPTGVAADRQGNVYIADSRNSTGSRVRKVRPDGTITTFAGGGSSLGDGGPATSARLFGDLSLAVGRQGNVYIADRGNDRVRMVSPAGTITTFAGGGSSLGDGGSATSARLITPYGVAVDREGNVYISDYQNHRVRNVSPGGTITTFAGTGSGGYSGDSGAATSARLYSPYGLAVDEKGSVYIAEYGNRTVRKVAKAAAATAAMLTLGGASPQRILAQKGITVTARCNKPCSLAAVGSVTILGTRYAFGLASTTVNSAAAGARTLTLRFPAAEHDRFRRLLRPGQQARAVITVKATDSAGRSTTSKRTVAVTSTSARTTQPSTSASSGTATLRTFVARIENALRQSAAGRRELAAALAAGFNCSISPTAAAQRTDRVVDNRRSVLRQLGSLQAPDRQSRDALGLLRAALQHSITADIHYRDGFSTVTNPGCPLPSNASFALARRSDALASKAKQRFVAVFNQLARRVDRRTWSATEI